MALSEPSDLLRNSQCCVSNHQLHLRTRKTLKYLILIIILYYYYIILISIVNCSYKLFLCFLTWKFSCSEI